MQHNYKHTGVKKMKHIAISILCFLILSSSVSADTYTCDAVEDKAKLGYDGSSKVSVVGKDKVCSFSVGGASVDGSTSRTTRVHEQFLRKHALIGYSEQAFANLIREVASLHGDRANFVQNLLDGRDIRPQSCGGSQPNDVDGLYINCKTIDAQDGDGFFLYESSWMRAHMVQPRLVVSIEERTTNGDAMYIFLVRR